MTKKSIVACFALAFIGLIRAMGSGIDVDSENGMGAAPTPTPTPVVPLIFKTPKIKPVDFSDFEVGANSYFENSLQVVAPNRNPQCKNGQIVMNVGDPAGIRYRDLLDSDGNISRPPMISVGNAPVKDGEWGTDNAILTLKDGSLLTLRQSIYWADVPNKPSWWNKISIQKKPLGSRVVVLAHRSTDCGKTWTQISALDPMNYQNGIYAVPRPSIDAFGGWDRFEAYADPWTGDIFISTSATGGKDLNLDTKTNATENYTSFVFKSSDQGKTWKLMGEINGWTPMVMTTTKNGKLFIFSVVGNQPTVYYSYDKNTKISPGFPVNYTAFDSKLKADLGIYYSCSVYKATNSVSRITGLPTTNWIRASYPVKNAFGQTGIAVIKIMGPTEQQEAAWLMKTPLPPSVSNLALVYAKDPQNGTVLSSSFIEPDPLTVPSTGTDQTILWWLEAYPTTKLSDCSPFSLRAKNGRPYLKSGGSVSSRYIAMKDDKFLGLTSSEPFSKDALGQPRSWNIDLLTLGFYRDYAYGAAYSTGNYMNFLGHWREEDGVRANVVSIKR